MFGFIADTLNNMANQMYQDERQEDSQQFNSGEALINRQFQERMRASQYQTAVTDMQAAGLNPMLAYHHGGAGTPIGATASSSAAGAPHSTPPSASMQSAAQVELAQAAADKARAEADEVRARTPTHAVTIEKMRQEIGESAVRIENIWQQMKTGAASAGLMEQQARNLQEEIPKIRAQINQLKSSTELNKEMSSEIRQRVQQNLPRLDAIAKQLENKLREIQQPGHYQAQDVRTSFIGLLGEYLRALNPLNAFIDRVPSK